MRMNIKYKTFAVTYSLLLYTAIRAMILVIIPLGYSLFNRIFYLSIEKTKIKLFGGIFFVSSIVGLALQWIDLENVIIAAWVFIPILILFFCCPSKANFRIDCDKLIKITAIAIFIVDILGIILNTRGTLTSIYGEHYEVVHGMAMVNALYLFYYGVKFYKREANLIEKIAAAFFGYYFFLCDFGVGKMCLVVTIGIYLLIHAKVKYFILTAIAVACWTYLSKSEMFQNEMMQMNYAQESQDNARKTLMFSEVPKFFAENPVAAIVGCGPGGYNSRATQLINQDANNIFTDIFGKHSPLWYKKYIYPLWNHTFVSMSSYTDGTRNKPFSSFVAVLCEYGGLALWLVFGTWGKRIIFYLKKENESIWYSILLWINLFYFISCIAHEWMDCTEFVAFLMFNYLLLNELLKNKNKLPYEKNIFCR